MGRQIAAGRGSVFVTDPTTLQSKRYDEGDEIPEGIDVGPHLFVEPEDDGIGNSPVGATPAFHPAQAGVQQEPAGYDPGEQTVDEVVAYVGDDADRAAAVLELEQAGKDRKGVVEALQAVVDKGSGSAS